MGETPPKTPPHGTALRALTGGTKRKTGISQHTRRHAFIRFPRAVYRVTITFPAFPSSRLFIRRYNLLGPRPLRGFARPRTKSFFLFCRLWFFVARQFIIWTWILEKNKKRSLTCILTCLLMNFINRKPLFYFRLTLSRNIIFSNYSLIWILDVFISFKSETIKSVWKIPEHLPTHLSPPRR